MRRLALLACLTLLWSSAVAAVTHPCHTPALLDGLRAPPGPAVAQTSSREKEARNPWLVPFQELTENFAIRYGGGWTPNEAGLATLAEALEDAWSIEMGTTAHPAPWSTDTTLLNVYIGDTGGGTPGSFGAGGYFSQDDDGYPILVINPASLDEEPWTRVVAIHELYHAVQWGLDTYSYVEGEPGAWYWEATASWIPGIVDPGSAANASFLWGFALAAHLPLDAFDYPDTGELVEYHQYGAMIFPTYLSEHVADWQPVRNSWVAPAGGTTDPIEALRGELDALGLDFDVVFTEFVAANAFWDYAHADAYASFVAGGQQGFPGTDPVTAWIREAGAGSIAPDVRPRRYGSNTVRFDLDPGQWRLELECDSTGSDGNPANWGVTLVRRDGDITYELVPITEGAAELVLDVDDADLALTVAAWTGPRSGDESFGWGWTLTEIPSGDDDDTVGDDDDSLGDDDDSLGADDDDGFGGSGCGCSSGHPPPSALIWLVPLALSRRRRPRR